MKRSPGRGFPIWLGATPAAQSDRMTEAITDLEPRVRRIVSRWDHDPTATRADAARGAGGVRLPASAPLPPDRAPAAHPVLAGNGSGELLLVHGPRAAWRYRVLFSDNITDRMAGSERLMEALCHRLWVEPGKVSEDGLVSVGRTSCTGMCDQGPALLVNGRAIPALTDERVASIARLDPRAGAGRRVAGGVLRRAGQRAPRRHPARPHGLKPGDADPGGTAARDAGLVRARSERALLARGLRRRRAGPDRDARGDQALEPARPRRRRLHHRHQVGGLPARDGPRALRGLQRRRRRARHVQGSRAAHQPCRPGVRGHDGRRAMRSARATGFLYLRGEYRYLLEPLESVLRATARGEPARRRHLRPARLRLRHPHPRRRGLLRLRRGVRPDRVARGQARRAAQPPALSGHERLQAAADDREQRRDACAPRR